MGQVLLLQKIQKGKGFQQRWLEKQCITGSKAVFSSQKRPPQYFLSPPHVSNFWYLTAFPTVFLALAYAQYQTCSTLSDPL